MKAETWIEKDLRIGLQAHASRMGRWPQSSYSWLDGDDLHWGSYDGSEAVLFDYVDHFDLVIYDETRSYDYKSVGLSSIPLLLEAHWVPWPGKDAWIEFLRKASPEPKASSERRVGIEIEFTGLAFREAKGILPPQMILGRDNSVTKDPEGLECKTPPLPRAEGIALAKEAVRAIRDAGGRVDETCGLHVHVECTDRHQIGAAWMDVEDDFIAWAGAEDRSRGYYAQTWGGRKPKDRYYSLNIFSEYPTVEFRLYRPTLDPDELERRVEMSWAFTERAEATGRFELDQPDCWYSEEWTTPLASHLR